MKMDKTIYIYNIKMVRKKIFQRQEKKNPDNSYLPIPSKKRRREIRGTGKEEEKEELKVGEKEGRR